MKLNPGQELLHYEIVELVGAGGMGEVYRARDRKLGRDVAIKALPEHLATDPARLERFEREARTLAGLNHPNVAGIHGIEEQDGARYLILEFVDGQTLAERLAPGPLPIDEAVDYAVQIAAGVESAHEAAVIHRDLKPDNIKINPDGVVKVLDFGLARVDEDATSSVERDAPTMTTPNSPTIAGAILGTAAYMSPEQARGRRVDKRTDIWSFGVVLFEMLTGASPFAGETASDSIGAVLHKQFDFDRLPAETPANVRRVLERCIERDAARRFRDIGDVRIELLREDTAPAAIEAPARSSRVGLTAIALLGLALSAIVGVAAWNLGRSSSPEPERIVRRADVAQTNPAGKSWISAPVISPDGRRIAFVRDGQIHIRPLDSFESAPLPGTEGARGVFWSPDSRDLGFQTADGIYVLRDLRPPAARASTVEAQYGQVWTDDGRILASTDNDAMVGIVSFPATGGEATMILEPDPEETIDYHRLATIAGSGVHLAIEHRKGGVGLLIAFDGSRSVTLAEGIELVDSSIAWSPSGHVLYTRNTDTSRDLWAVPFSPDKMLRTGEPFLVMPQANHPSVATDQTLLVLRGSTSRTIGGVLGWLDTSGAFQQITDTENGVGFPVPAPDDSLVAFASMLPGTQAEVWVHDSTRDFNRPIAMQEGVHLPLAWSPDGSEIMVLNLDLGGGPATTHFYAANGSGETRPSIAGFILGVDPSWNRAAMIQWSRSNRKTDRVSVVALDDPQTTLHEIEVGGPTAPTGGRIFRVAISPDGQHMLYASPRSGREEVYCVSWPSGAGMQQVSIEGGLYPMWSSDGSKIIFRTPSHDDERLMEVLVTRDETIRFSRPRPVFPEAFEVEGFRWLQPSQRGDRFAAIRIGSPIDEQTPSYVSIIENWHEPFRNRAQR